MHNKLAIPVKKLLLLLLVCVSYTAFTQQSIGLGEALAISEKNIPANVSKDELQVSLSPLPKTLFGAELGQVNSIRFDNKLYVMQSLPPLGSRLAELNLQKAASRLVHAEQQQSFAEKKLSVVQKYIELWYYRQHGLYYSHERNRSSASSGNDTLKRLEGLRLLQENALHQSLATQTELEIKTLLALEDNSDISTSDVLALLLHSKETLKPRSYASISEAEADKFKQERKWERTLRRPELEVGYINQSFIGAQTLANGQEKTFDGGKRFHSAMINFSFPLFSSNNKARLQQLRADEQVLRSSAVDENLKLNNYQQRLTKEAEALEQYTAFVENELKAINGSQSQQNYMLPTISYNYKQHYEPVYLAYYNQLKRLMWLNAMLAFGKPM